jgi:flavin reductase (DIM6/NTAB) family NADH-FMN oxidoreductase RutF
MMGSTPPLVVIGMQSRPDGRDKDSLANATATGELVVNLVAQQDAAAMALTSLDYDPGVDETQLAGLDLLASDTVQPPRIASAPVSLECKVSDMLRTGVDQTMIIAQVQAMHVLDKAVLDAARGHIDTPALQLLGRMEGPAWYTRCEGREQISASLPAPSPPEERQHDQTCIFIPLPSYCPLPNRPNNMAGHWPLLDRAFFRGL